MGMVEFGFSDTSGAGRIGKSIYTNLRAPRFAGKPAEESPKLIKIPAVIRPPARPDAGDKQGRRVGRCIAGRGRPVTRLVIALITAGGGAGAGRWTAASRRALLGFSI
jgi:hypothetical protein